MDANPEIVVTPDGAPSEPAAMASPRRAPAGYELVDCGEGRRLERFGPHLLDRPAPATAELPLADPSAWRRADARYLRAAGGRGHWEGHGLEDGWPVAVDDLVLECRPLPTGGVGLFPEHAPVWRWARRAAERRPGLRLLNLFAHTGALTLAAAAGGARVAHVDAARSAVAWARANAAASGLADRPIRWLVDDAEGFVARELRRGSRYDAIVLDPPSYGHGPGGSAWRLEERLPDLLRGVVALGGLRPDLLVVTAHTPGYDADRLRRTLLEAFPPTERRTGQVDAGPLELRAASGAVLPSGAYARWRGPKG